MIRAALLGAAFGLIVACAPVPAKLEGSNVAAPAPAAWVTFCESTEEGKLVCYSMPRN